MWEQSRTLCYAVENFHRVVVHGSTFPPQT